MSEPLAPLPGGAVDDLESLVAEVARRHQLEAAVAERLVRLYGSEVTAVLGVRPTPLSASAFAEEVAWAVEVEGARRLEDVLYRRLRAAWFLPAERDELIQRGGRVMAERLGWDDGRLGREREAVRARLDQELAFRRVTPPSAERAGSGRG
jgi:glycerol-3-phosphate dehydrogenase